MKEDLSNTTRIVGELLENNKTQITMRTESGVKFRVSKEYVKKQETKNGKFYAFIDNDWLTANRIA